MKISGGLCGLSPVYENRDERDRAAKAAQMQLAVAVGNLDDNVIVLDDAPANLTATVAPYPSVKEFAEVVGPK